MDRVNILGIDIHNLTMDETLDKIELFLKEKEKQYTVFTPNVDFLVKARKDPQFMDVLNRSDILIPDGKPLIWASRFLKTPLKEKVAGSDLFFKFCQRASEPKKGYRIFLLGAAEGVAPKAADILMNTYRGLNIVGTYSPPLDFERDPNENKKIIRLLEESRAHVLFVGLSQGKGEKWIHIYKDHYKIPVSIQVGASFDFAARIKRMPPQAVKKIGLAWLWRLGQEPRRLWRRYLVEDMKFFYYIFKQKRGGDL
jgi:N-acetylglucosaminyldiphosphoundecaprenol N-acetyl-beta-D-mannosaminyltransferase